MLKSLHQIIGYEIEARDEVAGKVRDLYFDDLAWVVRYFVVDTGSWLRGKRVLLAPAAVGEPRWAQQVVPSILTRRQIAGGPHASEDIPLSRQLQIELANAYGWQRWWTAAMETPIRLPALMPPAEARQDVQDDDWDPNLRSTSEVLGYHIQARDGELGQLDDFICDTNSWAIRYMVLDTRKWLPGRRVLLDLGWIDRLDWHAKRARVGLSREQIKNAPPFDPEAPINRAVEQRFYDYYGRPC
jgi:hypothetical protein